VNHFLLQLKCLLDQVLAQSGQNPHLSQSPQEFPPSKPLFGMTRARTQIKLEAFIS